MAIVLVMLAIRADAAPPLPGYRHDVWLQRDGAPSRINSITQSPDGFLWIGSVEGLFRFDGLEFERIALVPPGQAPLVVSQVLATDNGDIWVGLARGKGVRIVRQGKVIDPGMPHPSREVNDIRVSPSGEVWIARGGRSRLALARFSQGRWMQFGKDEGLPDEQIWSLMFGRDGALWAVCDSTVMRLPPGARRFEPTGLRILPRASLAQSPNGEIWLSDAAGTRQVVPYHDGSAAAMGKLYKHPDPVGGTRILFDRQGNLWETTWNSGVIRYALGAKGRPQPSASHVRVTTLDAAADLSSDQTHALFQDREGNIWIGTELGLDMLARSALMTERAIPANPPSSFRMTVDGAGAVYISDAAALYVAPPGGTVREVRALDSPSEALCAAHGGGIWVVTQKTATLVGGTGQQQQVRKPAGVRALGCAEDAAGSLWMPGLNKGLYRLRGGQWQVLDKRSAAGLSADAVLEQSGKAVILFRAPYQGSNEDAFTAVTPRLSQVGAIEGMLTGQGDIMISGAKGLQAPFTPGKAVLLRSRYPWAGSLNGLVETKSGITWGIGDIGIVRLQTADLARAFMDGKSPVPYRVFDYSDGLASFVQKAPGAQVAEGGDGRIWFLTRGNVFHIDPARLNLNRRPPGIVLKSLEVRGRNLAPGSPLTLAAGTSSVTIHYTATALADARRIKFRYRYGSPMGDWIDAGNARSVTLGSLVPGEYEFQITGANEDGIWNPSGAAIRFSIAHAYYQTWWFWLLCIGALMGLFCALHVMRLRYLGALIRDRLAERNRERERIARDLHDTLLQGVQGLLMRFQSIADQLPPDSRLHAPLAAALDRAEEALVEGRERVVGLRRLDSRDLVGDIGQLLDAQHIPPGIDTALTTSGARLVAPEVLDDVVAIAGEAIHNVVKHAKASELLLHIEFGRRGLTVIVRDNGIGFAQDRQASSGPLNNFGLIGMQERASRIGGRISITSSPGNGTQVHFTLRARLAYAV